MDPDENLAEQRQLATRILSTEDNLSSQLEHDAYRLAELVVAMDAWLVRRGFKPTSWHKG